jgi:hypothetical protein
MAREIVVTRINTQKTSVATVGPQGFQGYQGPQGNFGGATFAYDFNTSTSSADPGAGKLALNNATFSSATVLYLDDVDMGGIDIQSYLRTIDDSTSTIKGHFRISERLDPQAFVLYTITSLTEETGYFAVSCSYVSGSSPTFSNNEDLLITFARTGDKGEQGPQGNQGTQGFQGNQGFQSSVQGPQGYQGTQGFQGDEGLTWLGEFDVYSNYEIGDVVQDDGSSWVCIANVTGQTPPGGGGGGAGDEYCPENQPAYWDLLASIGDTGPQGDQGFQGNQGYQGFQGAFGGPQGDQGEPGVPGAVGVPGEAGTNGTNGTNGDQGAQGDWATAQTLSAKTASYTLLSTDVGKLITFNSGSAVVLSVNAGLGLTAGQRIDILQIGAGQVTFGGTATILATPSLLLRAQYSAATLIKATGTDTFYLVGDLAASGGGG